MEWWGNLEVVKHVRTYTSVGFTCAAGTEVSGRKASTSSDSWATTRIANLACNIGRDRNTNGFWNNKCNNLSLTFWHRKAWAIHSQPSNAGTVPFSPPSLPPTFPSILSSFLPSFLPSFLRCFCSSFFPLFTLSQSTGIADTLDLRNICYHSVQTNQLTRILSKEIKIIIWRTHLYLFVWM